VPSEIPSELVHLVRKIHAECAERITHDDQLRDSLWREGLIGKFIANFELGWWLREQVHGKDSPITYCHVSDLVRALNLASALLLHHGLPEPANNVEIVADPPRAATIAAAHRFLARAALLTDPRTGAMAHDPAAPRLRAAALNNLACLRKRLGDLPGALAPLEDAAAALRAAGAGTGQPAAAHGAMGLRLAVVRLNLAAVLAAAGARRRALTQAEAAAAMLERSVLSAEGRDGGQSGDSDGGG
jgi:hypothetical protein